MFPFDWDIVFLSHNYLLMKQCIFLLLALVQAFHLFADVTLPKIFGDNMVLQRNKPIPLWGWGKPNEKITIRFNHQTKTLLRT